MFIFSSLYFISLVIVGSFFVLNLVLAVIMDANESYDSEGEIRMDEVLGIDDYGTKETTNSEDENFLMKMISRNKKTNRVTRNAYDLILGCLQEGQRRKKEEERLNLL